MKKRLFYFLIFFLSFCCLSEAASAKVHYFSGTVRMDDCNYNFAGWYDENGHGSISWSGPCGSGHFNWIVANPDNTTIEEMSSFGEIQSAYSVEGDIDGNEDLILEMYNYGASDPTW
jgi:hypothetical protein